MIYCSLMGEKLEFWRPDIENGCQNWTFNSEFVLKKNAKGLIDASTIRSKGVVNSTLWWLSTLFKCDSQGLSHCWTSLQFVFFIGGKRMQTDTQFSKKCFSPSPSTRRVSLYLQTYSIKAVACWCALSSEPEAWKYFLKLFSSPPDPSFKEKNKT